MSIKSPKKHQLGLSRSKISSSASRSQTGSAGLSRNTAVVAVFVLGLCLLQPATSWAKAKAWSGTITIPTYPFEDDVNPKFWAMEEGAKLSTTIKGAIIYPYTMQDHLSRTKIDRTYKAVFLENEYLKITCLPELGGRLHSVFDKATGQEMFHLNRVIKPSMIAMRGAFISGGVEWNTGPHAHTVTIMSPVDVVSGENEDGSAYLEVNNVEKIFRTRWTVRVTLHPGKKYLDEQIRIANPTDGMHPYYFWNCTAFPCRAGTRFIYPMSLGTDHNGREFFSWPVHKGKDLSWLKNYEIYSSIFSVRCQYDFFGAYDVDANRGIVQVANHHELGGKKAWTWGTWEFGQVAQKNLTDDDGPYIEVQSGPLPTQSDYEMLGPHQDVAWQEWWYPVHGLGQGFEYATKDVAVESTRKDGRLELRLIATGKYPAVCCLTPENGKAVEIPVVLSPEEPRAVALDRAGTAPVKVTIRAGDKELASFTTPLPIPKVNPPDPAKFVEKPDNEKTVEQLYLKGYKLHRDTDRLKAREYYQKTLEKDAGHVGALRGLAILDFEAGLYPNAISRLQKALDRDSSDGLSWFYLGVCRLRLNNAKEALRCGHEAAKYFGTKAIGYDLAGRAAMRLGDVAGAIDLFTKAVQADPRDERASDHLMLALYAGGQRFESMRMARAKIRQRPTDLVARFLLALSSTERVRELIVYAHTNLGEREFEILDAALVLHELGLDVAMPEFVGPGSKDKINPLVLYYLAYLTRDSALAMALLQDAAEIDRDFVFPSRPEEVDILKFAIEKNPRDANAHLHLGNLYAHLGQLELAVRHWEKAAELNPKKSMPLRNLGIYAWSRGDLAKGESLYRQAIAARPSDQTLFRDLAELLIAAGKRPEAIKLIETMPLANGFKTSTSVSDGQKILAPPEVSKSAPKRMRRAEITITLAQAYNDEKRFDDTVKLLESTPYFVNWEGQDVTWRLFNKAHVERGKVRFEKKDMAGALADFEAALTYPANLNVGRSNEPDEAAAQYWRGKALQALGRSDAARAAWKAGAEGHEGSGEQKEYRQRCREALEGK